MSSDEPLGVIAGGGRLPLLLAREAQASSRRLVVVSIAAEPDPELRELASAFEQVPVGKIASILKAFETAGASELAILGSARKEELFRRHTLDWLALKILARAKTRGDQALFAAIADEFGSRGFRVVDQRDYLKTLAPSAGTLTRRKPSRAQARDAAQALELARQIAALDIGQTVVAKDGVPLAVEAIEGTDSAIQRGASLGGEGVVVAKAARPEHDFRFDVPTVGLGTLATLRQARAAMLVLEAQRTFLLDRDAFLRGADEAKIVVLALD